MAEKKKWLQSGALLTISAASLLGFLLLWELICRSGVVDAVFLPAPTQVLGRAIRMWDQHALISNIAASTRRVMVGFFAAVVVSIPLGIMLGTSRVARAVLDPILSFLRPLPSMSWIPLTLLWFGITETQKYSIVFMGSVTPALLYVIDATQGIDPLLIVRFGNQPASQPGGTAADEWQAVVVHPEQMHAGLLQFVRRR